MRLVPVPVPVPAGGARHALPGPVSTRAAMQKPSAGHGVGGQVRLCREMPSNHQQMEAEEAELSRGGFSEEE